MRNTNGFYKISKKRIEKEEELQILNNKIKKFRDDAKKMKKGSAERILFNHKAIEIKESKEYLVLEAEVNMLNLAINAFCYS